MNLLSRWLRAAWPVLLIAAIIIAFDQWTKEWVRNTIEKNTERYIPFPSISDYVWFQHVDNYGAAFGILQNQRLLFTVIAIGVAIAILVYVMYIPKNQWFIRLLLGLQLGGAIGNLIDRRVQGYVTDFVVTGIPDFYYIPNYNVADAAIVSGVIGLGIFVIGDDIRQHRQHKAMQAQQDAVDLTSP